MPPTVWPNCTPLDWVVLKVVRMGAVLVFAVTVMKPATFSRLKVPESTFGAKRVCPGWSVWVTWGGEASGRPRLRKVRVTSTGPASGLRI